MKIQVICCILAVAFAIVGGNVSPKNELEEHLLNLFTKWSSGGVETSLFSLPSLKSISIDEIKATYDENRINLDITIGEMELTGLDNFVVQTLDVTQTEELLNISIGLLAPNLVLYAENYDLDGRAYLIYPLRGSGSMTVEARNNLLSLNILITSIDNSSSTLENFSLGYNIGEVEANLERSSWPINDVLSDEGKNILESYQDELLKAVNEYVLPAANKYLSNVSIKELVNIIADVSANSVVVESV